MSKKTSLKLVFLGTPEFVVPVLGKLCATYNTVREKNVIGVVTQPPRPAGRNKHLERSAVDNWAFAKKLEIITDLNQVPEADLGVVAAYGALIPQSVIDKFQHGVLNIHPSLLPKYRGASPIQSALVAGEDKTGVTVIKMDAELDHGEIISSFEEKILKDDTNGNLRSRLFSRAAEFLIELIPGYVDGKIKLHKQNHKKATFCRVITKADGFIDPRYLGSALEGKTYDAEWKVEFIKDFAQKPTAENIERFVRAMDPWPVAWSNIDLGLGKVRRIKILSSHVEEKKLVIERVQLEGKAPVKWKQFCEGYPSAKFS